MQSLQSTVSYTIKYWALKPRWHWTFSFSSAVPRPRRGKKEDDTYARPVCCSSFPSWQATVSCYSGNALATYSSKNHLWRYQAGCMRIRISGGLDTWVSLLASRMFRPRSDKGTNPVETLSYPHESNGILKMRKSHRTKCLMPCPRLLDHGPLHFRCLLGR